MVFISKEVGKMKTTKEVTIKEALSILERMRYEAEYNSQPDREAALKFAIEAVKKNVEYEQRCTDDGK